MTRTITIITSIDIAAPAEAVWPSLVDWEHLDRWMREAKNFMVIGAQREGVGVEAEATVSIAGIRTRDRIRVTRWDPPALLELEHLGWVSGTGTMELSPIERGCHLFWREELIPPWGPIGFSGMRLLLPVMKGIFRRDLRLLKELVEQPEAPGD